MIVLNLAAPGTRAEDKSRYEAIEAKANGLAVLVKGEKRAQVFLDQEGFPFLEAQVKKLLVGKSPEAGQLDQTVRLAARFCELDSSLYAAELVHELKVKFPREFQAALSKLPPEQIKDLHADLKVHENTLKSGNGG